MTRGGIRGTVEAITDERLGFEMNPHVFRHFAGYVRPHRFRHVIATTVPLRAPEHPALAASLLGISKDVVETHYNRSQQVSAVLTFSGREPR